MAFPGLDREPPAYYHGTMRILRQYLLSEIMALFGLSLAIITVLFMSQRIIQMAEWAINRGVGLADMSRLLLYLIPTLMLIIFPIVTLFSILLGVGRLSSDNELVALKSSGLSLYRLFPPVVLFAAFACALALGASQLLIPKAAQASRVLQYKIVKTRTESAVTEGIFIDLLPKTTFYVRKKKDDGELRGVMAAVEDWPEDSTWRSRQVVFARFARFVNDPELLRNELWLRQGVMIQEDREAGREDVISFESCRLRLDLDDERVKFKERMQELDFFSAREAMTSTGPLSTNPSKENKVRLDLAIQFHERLAWPLGCLALCLWAVPLGIQPPRAGRARSIVVAVVLSAVFYYLTIMARFAALKGLALPGPAVWAPDLVIAVTGAYMLRQKNNERPILLLSWLEDMAYHLGDRFKAYLERRRAAG